MDIDCLVLQQKPFRVHLSVVSQMVRCQIRESWVPATPEELVRQTILMCIQEACHDMYPHAMVIRVEHSSLDIALYPAPIHPAFCPALPPILIIETKRREIHPVDTEEHKKQLLGYLQRMCCTTGALTNCRTLWCYRQYGTQFRKTLLNDVAELVAILRQNHWQAQQELKQQQQWFDLAKAGCFKSFHELVQRYGRGADSTITFVYERNKIPVLAHGFLFKITDGRVRFMLRRQSLRKREECTAQAFRRLVSIQSLEYQTDGV